MLFVFPSFIIQSIQIFGGCGLWERTRSPTQEGTRMRSAKEALEIIWPRGGLPSSNNHAAAHAQGNHEES